MSITGPVPCRIETVKVASRMIIGPKAVVEQVNSKEGLLVTGVQTPAFGPIIEASSPVATPRIISYAGVPGAADSGSIQLYTVNVDPPCLHVTCPPAKAVISAAAKVTPISKNVTHKIKNNTFGANIHSLYRESFFMKNGSMGALATRKIESVIEKINNSSVGELLQQKDDLIDIIVDLNNRNIKRTASQIINCI